MTVGVFALMVRSAYYLFRLHEEIMRDGFNRDRDRERKTGKQGNRP
jgi:hypothetical protein